MHERSSILVLARCQKLATWGMVFRRELILVFLSGICGFAQQADASCGHYLVRISPSGDAGSGSAISAVMEGQEGPKVPVNGICRGPDCRRLPPVTPLSVKTVVRLDVVFSRYWLSLVPPGSLSHELPADDVSLEGFAVRLERPPIA